MDKQYEEYRRILNLNWQEKMFDSGCDNPKNNFTVDGENSRVYSHPTHGMEVYAGARLNFDADHTVLWTKDEFSGDIKVSYDFTRLDDAQLCVNIIYLMAQGGGHDEYVKDISKWQHLRKVPSMRTYFNNMNLYHISYAAFGMEDSSKYIRARRYCCTKENGPVISPDYMPDDFFAPMETHRLTFIKKDDMLYFHIKHNGSSKEKLCTWKLTDSGELTHGRVGLRQMFTRNSRYKNISISVI